MKILLAVSGGADSMYLACRAPEFFPGAEVAVAHCNFSLRGEESDGDEAFVRDWCARNRIACLVGRFDTAGYASSKGISIEMAARQLRYGWFSRLCAAEGFDAVAVAHNASDNAETLFLNLLRGTGIKGISGMCEDGIGESGCRILRPMLGTSREEISQWLLSHSQSWREDRTNSENEFKRNKLRNLVFPILKEINPDFLHTLSEDMKHFAQAGRVADEYTRSAARTVILADGTIDTAALLGFSEWKYLLWRFTSGGVNSRQLEMLTGELESGGRSSGKVFGDFILSKGLLIPQGSIPKEEECRIEVLDAGSISSLKVPEGTLLLDKGKLGGPVRIRKWREGDWMRPLGMKGKKKISDLFVDLGWDERRKRSARVVEMAGSHVAALLFVRIDEAVKITPGTKEVIRLTI